MNVTQSDAYCFKMDIQNMLTLFMDDDPSTLVPIRVIQGKTDKWATVAKFNDN